MTDIEVYVLIVLIFIGGMVIVVDNRLRKIIEWQKKQEHVAIEQYKLENWQVDSARRRDEVLNNILETLKSIDDKTKHWKL